MSKKLPPALAISPRRELAVIKDGADPHVVHECRKADHHGAHAQGPSELVLAALIPSREVLLSLNLPIVCYRVGFAAVPVRIAIGVSIRIAIGVSVGVSIALLSMLGAGPRDSHEVVRLRCRFVCALEIGHQRLALGLSSPWSLHETRSFGLAASMLATLSTPQSRRRPMRKICSN